MLVLALLATTEPLANLEPQRQLDVSVSLLLIPPVCCSTADTRCIIELRCEAVCLSLSLSHSLNYPQSIIIVIISPYLAGPYSRRSLAPQRKMEKSNSSSSGSAPPHFVLIPWMAQGHVIPMIDIARLIAARRAAEVTVVTTPGNASRIEGTIARLSGSGLPIRFATIRFPSLEAGLPEGCENLDSIPSRDMARNFYDAAKLLRGPMERLLHRLDPPLSCIVCGIGFPWLDAVARELGAPRLVFQGFSCFSLLASHCLYRLNSVIPSPEETIVLPGLPHRVEIAEARLPKCFDRASKFVDIYRELRDGEMTADGFVVNSFAELEPGYQDRLEGETGKKVWIIGPVSLSNTDRADSAERGNKAAVDERRIVDWLDGKPAGSVIYVSFGSMGRIEARQWIEMGVGLQSTGRPFIWVVRTAEGLDTWLARDGGFEERAEGRCLLIRGWAPQMMILAHRSVGAFVTHCGWNSALEGVCAGVPMVTWPLGAEQFLNEKLVVEVLRVGVSVGASAAEEDVVVEAEEVARAVEMVMDGGNEGEERRRRARELREMARTATEDGGSSCSNLTHLIQYVTDVVFPHLHALRV